MLYPKQFHAAGTLSSIMSHLVTDALAVYSFSVMEEDGGVTNYAMQVINTNTEAEDPSITGYDLVTRKMVTLPLRRIELQTFLRVKNLWTVLGVEK